MAVPVMTNKMMYKITDSIASAIRVDHPEDYKGVDPEKLKVMGDKFRSQFWVTVRWAIPFITFAGIIIAAFMLVDDVVDQMLKLSQSSTQSTQSSAQSTQSSSQSITSSKEASGSSGSSNVDKSGNTHMMQLITQFDI